jgi:hypothetical protein
MPRPVLILDTGKVRSGRLEELRSSFADLSRFVLENEPRVLLYWVSFDQEGTHVSVIQLHPDSASAELHFELTGPLLRGFADLVEMAAVHVYGDPSEMLLERLRGKARALGGGLVEVHPFFAGFVAF